VTYVSWAPHCSRSDSTARELGGTSHMVYWSWLGSHPATIILKYAGQAFETWRLLLRERPDVVFVMTPPPIALVAVYGYCALLGVRYVVDAHTGVFLTRRWRHFQRLQFWLCRRALTTIVTNEHIAELVRRHGAAATVVADVPVQYEALTHAPATEDFTAAFVTSFDRDEPIAEMVEAARRLPGVRFFMTGDSTTGAQRLPTDLPPNLTLTGFLDSGDYGRMLRQAGVVIALTNDDHTMQRGAYEGIYHGTPVIVSDTSVLREAFDEGAEHVDNSARAIVEAIVRIRDDHGRYLLGASRLRERKILRWQQTKQRLLELLDQRQPVRS
jgi:glycosyltransferase involved in cell wall biosynthesis